MKVFISYSYADETLANRIRETLTDAGFDVWNAEKEILPGDNWAEKISDALKESNAMVVLLTSDALKSRAVHREIEFALGEKSYNNRLIPVLVEGADENLDERIPWILKRLKIIKLTESDARDEEINQIAQALKEVA